MESIVTEFPGMLLCMLLAASLMSLWFVAENDEPESSEGVSNQNRKNPLPLIAGVGMQAIAAAVIYVQAGPVIDPARDVLALSLVELVIHCVMTVGKVRGNWSQFVILLGLLVLRGAGLAAAYALFASADRSAPLLSSPSPDAKFYPIFFGIVVLVAAFLNPEHKFLKRTTFKWVSLALSVAAAYLGASTYKAYTDWMLAPVVLLSLETAVQVLVVFNVVPNQLFTAYRVALFGARGAIGAACFGEFVSSVSVPTGVSHLFFPMTPATATVAVSAALIVAHSILFFASLKKSGRVIHGLAATIGILAGAGFMLSSK